MSFMNHTQDNLPDDEYELVLSRHSEPTIVDHAYDVWHKCVCYSLYYCVIGGEILWEVLENIPDLPPLHCNVHM